MLKRFAVVELKMKLNVVVVGSALILSFVGCQQNKSNRSKNAQGLQEEKEVVNPIREKQGVAFSKGDQDDNLGESPSSSDYPKALEL